MRRIWNQADLTRLKTHSGAGAHRDRRRKRDSRGRHRWRVGRSWSEE
jgi:hypothetical protein